MRSDVRRRRCDAMLFKCVVGERKARAGGARRLHQVNKLNGQTAESDEERGEAKARGASRRELPVFCFNGSRPTHKMIGPLDPWPGMTNCRNRLCFPFVLTDRLFLIAPMIRTPFVLASIFLQ